MSHLYFNELSNVGKKTKWWEVTSTSTNAVLGIVKFYGAWRKFVFFPSDATLYDASCLRDIAAFAEQETKSWRESLSAKEPRS
jgi:hypothetical protein